MRWPTLLIIAVAISVAATKAMPQANSPKPRRDINAVLHAHDERLLAIPGVVGVYVALLEDGKTPCLKLMLSRPRVRTDQPLPVDLEGYRVISEVTGEIRPR